MSKKVRRLGKKSSSKKNIKPRVINNQKVPKETRPLPKKLKRKIIESIAQERGFRPIRQKGSHLIFKNEETGMSTSIPQKKTIPIGTAYSIAKQLGMTINEFRSAYFKQ